MLWTDAIFITPNDLIQLDPEVNEIASAESIVLDGPTGTIRRSLEDSGRELNRRLALYGAHVGGGELSANHLSAVFMTGGHVSQKQRAFLEQVVVSGRNSEAWSGVKRWAATRCLIAFYRTALNRAQKDRYDTKMQLFARDEQMAIWPQLEGTGLPIVLKPLEAPGAVLSRDPGSFSTAAVTGSGPASGTYDIVLTYVDESAYVSVTSPRNGESHPSAVSTAETNGSQSISIDISNLTPPTGEVHPETKSRGYLSLLRATGWNVYAGPAGGVLRLQNSTPIPIATKTYVLTSIVTSTAKVGMGQNAEANISFQNLLHRA